MHEKLLGYSTWKKTFIIIMYVKQLGLLLLLYSVTVIVCADFDSDSNLDVLVNSEEETVPDVQNAKTCDCGEFELLCKFVEGRKVCNCKETFADRLGTCTLCWCSGPSNTSGCKFDNKGAMKCDCLKGYAQRGNDCKECDCGDHGKCDLISLTSKACICDEGYAEKDGKCRACDCGSNGKCHFANGRKKCSCNADYMEYGGTCKECRCGANAACGFTNWGQKECKCIENYGMKDGVCKECNCYPGTSCTFDPYNPYSIETKTCICPNKYANDYGRCKECYCGVENSTCSFLASLMQCKCPPGYTSENDGIINYLKKVCKDIDECTTSYRCPYFNTICVNTPGSYDCECKDGYEKFPFKDIKMYGCQDIDECVRESRPCDDPGAECVNKIGSYECQCRPVYVLRKASRPKYNRCEVATRPWRIATIVVGVLAAIIIIGLLIGVGQKYRWW